MDQPLPTEAMPGQPMTPEQEFGDNFEKLPKEISGALWNLVEKVELDDYPARLAEVRRIKKARLFYEGIQHLYWSGEEGGWKTLSDHVGVNGIPTDDNAPNQYVTNIYQGNALSFCAVFGQNTPSVAFNPQNQRDESDRATAAEAKIVAQFIAQENKIDDQGEENGLLLFTDGCLGTYTRFVVDGYNEEPDIQPVPQKIGQDTEACAQCGYEGPVTGSPTCPQCGAPIAVRPAPVENVPQQVGIKKVPYGHEEITFVPKLELKIPSYAKDRKSTGYLTWAIEVPIDQLKETYPHVAEELKASNETGTDNYERNARLASKSPRETWSYYGPGYESLATFKRTWLRPWQFNSIDDAKIRDQVKKLYPEGCYVAFAGKTYCESRPESMDDHWRWSYALPGFGNRRPAVGDSLVSVQERYNTMCNIEIETYEHGIPIGLANANAMDVQALKNAGNLPGGIIPVNVPTGVSVKNSFDETEPARVSPQIARSKEELVGPTAQFLTGLFPAVFGGGVVGNDTASGYAMQRDQGMGRVGMIWRKYRRLMAETLELAVQTFKKNRTEDVNAAIMGPGNKFDSQIIHLDQLEGKFFAWPEGADDLPVSWTQQRNLLESALQNPNPILLQMLMSTPDNLSEFARRLGLDGFRFPGVDGRQHQRRETEAIMSGQAIMPNQYMDDHAAHIAQIDEYSESDEGQKARVENPDFFNLLAQHKLQHMQMLQFLQAPAQPQPAQQGDQSEQPTSEQPQ